MTEKMKKMRENNDKCVEMQYNDNKCEKLRDSNGKSDNVIVLVLILPVASIGKQAKMVILLTTKE